MAHNAFTHKCPKDRISFGHGRPIVGDSRISSEKSTCNPEGPVAAIRGDRDVIFHPFILALWVCPAIEKQPTDIGPGLIQSRAHVPGSLTLRR